MKKLILLVFLLSAIFYSSAQSVALPQATLTSAPLPSLEDNGTGVACINFVESSSLSVPSESFPGVPNVTISVSLQYIELTAADISVITGTLLNYFSVSYNATTNIITFTQNAIIPGDAYAQVCFPVTVIQNSTSAESYNGYNANINATDVFTNAQGNASVYTFTVPTAIDLLDDGVNVNEDAPTVIDVLNNDTNLPTNGTLLVSTPPTNGVVIITDPNGTPTDPTDDVVTYTPNTGYIGIDTFEYTVCDANNICDTAEVIITIAPVGIPYPPTAPAECFSVFVENNVTLTSGNTNGSLAAGGDLTINGNYGVASQDCGCFDSNGNEIGLLVGGQVNYNTGILNISNAAQYAQIGTANGSNAWYADPQNAPTPIRVTPGSDYNAASHIQLLGNAAAFSASVGTNAIFAQDVIDFSLAFQKLRTNSTSMSENVHNASLEDNAGNPISNTGLPSDVHIDLQMGTNYMNVTGADLNAVSNFTFNQPADATHVLVINIDAAGTFNWNVWAQANAGLTESPYILYNFYNTTDLQIEGSDAIAGTILAPFADITKTVNVATILGQVIGTAFTQDGGDVQCANFIPEVIDPTYSDIAPVAAFTVNENECLTGNEFVFRNTSNTDPVTQPTDPISYAWDFGDGTSSILMEPTKTYAAAGTYTVTMIATNTFGSDTATAQVTVLSETAANITMSTQASGNGSVYKEFTLTNPSDFASYSWSLAGQGTGLYPNQAQVDFNFSTAGSYTLTLSGINTNGCPIVSDFNFVIASGEVTGGNGGGVESESLGDAISKIYVGRKKNSVPTEFVKSSKNAYNKAELKSLQLYQEKGQTMLDMFPTELIAGNIANVTSPTDILDYTVADEVLSVDFSIEGQTKGVVLGIKTSDKIYNHTKASCDRLRGAEILKIETVQLEGYNFLMQGIKQRNGSVEYAISFATAKNNNDAEYTIQTNWYVNNYTKFNDVYNFQVWSTNPTDTQKLVSDILANLKGYIPVTQTEVQKVPETFAAKISRDKADLVILLRSIKEGLNTEISMEELYSETANNLKHRYNPLNTKLEQTLRIDIKDGYEYDALVKVHGEVEDAFYHADGNWGLDYDKNYTEVQNYFVSNDFERVYQDDEHAINRNIAIEATSDYDYLTVYKSLLPGTLSADYSEYNYVAFTAKGSGLTELGLIKSSIQEWKAQYRIMVDLSEEEQTYYVPFDAFTSTGTQNMMTAEDLTTLTFTFLPVEAQTKTLDLTISDVKFTKTAVEGQIVNKIETFENEFMLYPNPSKGAVTLLLFSETDTEAKITLTDVTGKTIYRGKAQLTAGKNELDLDFKVKPGVMLLQVNSAETNYGTSKVIFR